VISLVICTRNRATFLERALSHIADVDRAGRHQGIVWELLVVDNRSEDHTKRCVEGFASLLPIKYVYEAKPGLSCARNRAIESASHSIIAFTDDDCLIGDDWLASVVRAFAGDPELAILGGRVELADPTDCRAGTRGHRNAARIISIDDVLDRMIGCNMAFSRRVFDSIGLFDPAFGRGTRIGSAEDIDIVYRALRHGARIAYLPEAVIYHAHGRKTQLPDTLDDDVKGRGAFYCKFILRGDLEVLKRGYWEVRSLFRSHFANRESARLLRKLAAGAAYQLIRAAGPG
jgi:GT2 family glycosyltransferase